MPSDYPLSVSQQNRDARGVTGAGCPSPWDSYDRVLALLILLSTTVYLACLPHPLGWSDEAYFLYEARRVAEGEVMYRDIFEFITPGAVYVMALLFRLFGTTMTVAATGMAVLHGLTGMLLFAICRGLGVQRAISALTPLAYLALSHAAWPYASWHWFSTTALVVQCWALLRVRWPWPPWWAVIPGLISGLAVAVQQQRGIPLAVMVAVLFVVDHALGRLRGAREPLQMLFRRLALYGVGLLLAIVTLLVPSLWLAGVDVLIDSWVRFPLESYRPTFASPWGYVGPLTGPVARQTYPTVLARLPQVALAVTMLRLLAALARNRSRKATWRHEALLCLGAAAVLSVWYNPDFIHLSFVAPVFLIPLAEAAEWAFRRAGGQHTAVRAIRMAAVAAVAAMFGLRLSANMTAAWQLYPIAHQTAFGRVNFSHEWEPIMIDAVREQLRASGSLEMFCYPHLAAPYLTAGGRNPTRFQFADSKVLPRRYTEEITRILWERRVPTLVVSWAFMRADPVGELIRKEYAVVHMPILKTLPPLLLYRRKPGARLPAAPEFPVELF